MDLKKKRWFRGNHDDDDAITIGQLDTSSFDHKVRDDEVEWLKNSLIMDNDVIRETVENIQENKKGIRIGPFAQDNWHELSIVSTDTSNVVSAPMNSVDTCTVINKQPTTLPSTEKCVSMADTIGPIKIAKDPSGVIIIKQTFHFEEHPITMDCPNCKESITTTVQYRSGACTWLYCGLIALLGCPCGCCLIPFFMDCSKDVVHSCRQCNKMLGMRRRL